MSTSTVEGLDDATSGSEFREMGFSIEKVTVTAKARALKAEYSIELAQDLKAIHGLDAEQELSNILSTEILAEINREVVRTIYTNAVAGAQNNTANAGIFDLDVDSNGRWSVEKFKGLLFQIERDANAIGQQTRRGKGNILICSADVASALAMAGVLDYAPALAGNNGLIPDDTSSTLVGTLNGRIKVYVDPYSSNVADKHFYVAGYKGTSAYDAGLFYCPYVPLQQVRAINPNTFQAQDRIQDSLRHGLEPLRTRSDPRFWRSDCKQQQVLQTCTGCKPHVILVHIFHRDPTGSLFLCLHYFVKTLIQKIRLKSNSQNLLTISIDSNRIQRGVKMIPDSFYIIVPSYGGEDHAQYNIAKST